MWPSHAEGCLITWSCDKQREKADSLITCTSFLLLINFLLTAAAQLFLERYSSTLAQPTILTAGTGIRRLAQVYASAPRMDFGTGWVSCEAHEATAVSKSSRALLLGCHPARLQALCHLLMKLLSSAVM